MKRTQRPGDLPTAGPTTSDEMDAVFQALAHATRRRILDLLRDHPGLAVGEVAGRFEGSRIGVMKHLNVLEEAGLVVSRRVGRRRELFFNVVPIRQIHERWTDEYSALWADRLLSLKARVEGTAGATGEGSEGLADQDEAAGSEPTDAETH